MIGTLNEQVKQATVVGGGISGLLLAYALDKKGYEVTLLESAPRLGGMLQTKKTAYGIAETAAHSLLATPAVRNLCAELGIELLELRPDSRARYIVRRGRLRRFPLGFFEALRALFRAYFVLADKSPHPEKQSLEAWALRHLGRPALDYGLNPFLRGIYASRPSEIAVGAAFPALVLPKGHSLLSAFLHAACKRRWRRDGKRVRAEMVAPKLGMQSLVEALERELKKKLGARLKLGEAIHQLPDSPNVVLCVPAHVAAQLLGPLDPELSKALLRVKYAPLTTATCFLRNEDFGRAPRGVGYLAPEREGRAVLGMLFNSSAFEGRVKDPDSFVSVTAMLPGAKLDDYEIQSAMLKDFRDFMGLRKNPAHFEVTRWEHAIPKYGVEILDLRRWAREGWCSTPGHILFGNYTGQVSLRGLIESAQAL